MGKNVKSINIPSEDAGLVLYKLGYMFFYGEGVGKDIDVGVKYLIESANNGYAPANLFLARFYYNDGKFSVEIDEKTVKKTSRELIDMLSDLISQGNAEAFHLLDEIASNEKNEEILYEIALKFMDDNIPYQNDYDKAFKYLNRAKTNASSWNGELLTRINTKLGVLYYYGMGIEKDEKKAFNYFELSARDSSFDKDIINVLKKIAEEDDNPEIQYLIGLSDYENAARHFAIAKDKGHKKAAVKLALEYMDGFGGVEKDEEKAADILYSSVKEGNNEAYERLRKIDVPLFQYRLGLLLHEGVEGLIEKNDLEAVKIFENAENYNKAKIALANMYINGDCGNDHDKYDAFITLYKLAKDGDDNALNRLHELENFGYGEANYYLGCLCYDEQKYEKAAEHFKIGAEKGLTNGLAQFALGKMYCYGKGVEKDIHKALKYICRAKDEGEEEAFFFLQDMADYGVSEASYLIALEYHRMAKSDLNFRYDEEAKVYIEKAARGGIKEAQYLAGNVQRTSMDEPVYINEESITNGSFVLTEEERKKFETAAQFYLMTVAQENEDELYGEHADEKYALGSMFYYGIGVEQSYEEALKYYKMAANQGHEEAKYKIETIYHLGEDGENSDNISGEYKKAYDDANETNDLFVIKVKTPGKN